MLRIAEHFHDSDLGRQRQGNEDNYYVRSPLFVVADGMGGAQAGEVASAIAVKQFERGLPDGEDPGEALATLIQAANARIHEQARSDAQHAGMGTTTTAAYLTGDCVVVAHVGDSRCYLLRDGDLTRLTRDHSLVDELVRRGKLTEAQAEAHPQRSVITRALGAGADVEVDLEVFPARDGDLFLVCSDGLTGMVHEAQLKPLLEQPGSLERMGRSLIAAANDAGGRDNITVILFRLEEVEAAGGDGGGQATAAHHEEQARAHPLKNVVTRALGGESEVVVDVKEFDLRPGDVYLLCSDGLTTMLSDEEIEKRLQASQPADQICRSLVKDANSRGGLDNVTVVLLSDEATAEESD